MFSGVGGPWYQLTEGARWMTAGQLSQSVGQPRVLVDAGDRAVLHQLGDDRAVVAAVV